MCTHREKCLCTQSIRCSLSGKQASLPLAGLHASWRGRTDTPLRLLFRPLPKGRARLPRCTCSSAFPERPSGYSGPTALAPSRGHRDHAMLRGSGKARSRLALNADLPEAQPMFVLSAVAPARAASTLLENHSILCPRLPWRGCSSNQRSLNRKECHRGMWPCCHPSPADSPKGLCARRGFPTSPSPCLLGHPRQYRSLSPEPSRLIQHWLLRGTRHMCPSREGDPHSDKQ